VLSSEAQRSRQELQLIEARNLRETTAIALRQLIDLAPSTPIDLVDRLESTPPPPMPDAVSAQVSDALAHRSERLAQTERISGAEERQAATRAGQLPTITLGGGVDYARPNTRIFPLTPDFRTSWDAGVTLNWNVWDFGRTDAEVAEAGFAVTAARERLADLDRAIDAEVRQRLLDLDSSLAAVRASADGVRSATEARRVVDERFTVGVATNTDVLDAQFALMQAELDRTRALANVRLAEARLARALGR
jgi:outer membrane protein TolC